MWTSGGASLTVLLSRTIDGGGELPNVYGGDGGVSKATGVMCDAGGKWDENLYDKSKSEEGARGGDGKVVEKPPIGLSNLWPGRRVWFAGSIHGTWKWSITKCGKETNGGG
jgi:hypothetical protein